MQRALQERPKPQAIDQQIREQLDRHRLEIKAWKGGFFDGALVGFMLAFLIVVSGRSGRRLPAGFSNGAPRGSLGEVLQPRSPDVLRSHAK